MNIDFTSRITKAFSHNNVKELELIWQMMPKEQQTAIAFDSILTCVGDGDVRNLPVDTSRFFINNCGSQFVTALTHRFNMMICSRELNECHNYCRCVPALAAEWRKHFGVDEMKADAVPDKASTPHNVEQMAVEMISQALAKQDYAEARKCVEQLAKHIEFCEFVNKH